MEKIFTHRYIARVVLEAKTPLFVGSGESALNKDAIVQKDCWGLPMIPGTSLTGVLRHSLIDDLDDGKNNNEYLKMLDIFGCQLRKKDEKEALNTWFKANYTPKNNKAKEGLGSRIKLSSAYFLLGNEKVVESIEDVFNIPEELIHRLDNLPVRQHVRINDRGTAVKHGLFDNEIVYQGARFLFELELKGDASDKNTWDLIIQQLQSPAFRLGQGTRNGYGNLAILKLYNQTFNLKAPDDFESYLRFNSSLNADLNYQKVQTVATETPFIHYEMDLTPDDFFIFSEGFGDDQVDNKPITESVIQYSNGQINFEEKTLVPATSIKGAISHRVCFYYNQLKGQFADFNKGEIGNNNAAVAALFGTEAGKSKEEKGERGLVVMDDMFLSDVANHKIFNHVAIDRFTGGALDGALFSEKVSSMNANLNLELYVINSSSLNEDIYIEEALDKALTDICRGLLPLGGMTTKGHGMFTGTLKKNKKNIFSYK